jgi:hypothetical protein
MPFTVTLGNQDFTLQREVWPLDRIKLDPSNPRLQFTLRKTGMAASDKDLHRLIWDLDPVKGLYQSVYQNGGLIEDLVVKADGRVVEGNCRTVVLRELHKKYAQDTRWQQVYVRVLPDSVTDEQLMLLLGELHIAGKIEWRAIDQAEYVWRMHKIYGRTYDFLTSHLRWSRSRLSQKIAAYEETKAYAARTNDPKAISRFSHFEEFMGEKPLRERREADPTFMTQFGDWVAAGKFPDAKDVRALPKILDNTEALATLEKENFQKARAVLFAENPALSSNLYSIVDRASEQLETIALSELTALKGGDKPRVAKLRRLQKALRSIEPYIGPLPP